MNRIGTAITLLLLGAAAVSAQLADPEPEWYLRGGGGCRLFVQEFGRGRDTVIVLHGGWGADHSYLLDGFRGLEDRYHLVFYDQRGSLRSPCPDSLVSVAEHVADIERLRQQLDLQKVNIVGHSMGTRLAMMYLERHPDRVKGLVLTAPASLTPRPPATAADSALAVRQQATQTAFINRAEVQAELKRAKLDGDSTQWSDEERTSAWRIRFAGVNLYHVDRWKRMKGGQVFYRQAAANAAVRSASRFYDFTRALAVHPCPITVIQGDHDYGPATVDLQRAWIQRVSNVRHVIIERAGHAIWLDAPDAFRQALVSALQIARTCRAMPGSEQQAGERATVTVTQGTSMSVAASPDGRQLVIDLQGTLWVLPAGGGTARAITDPFNDARQPAWSPDGKLIVFQGYRAGGYDIWVVTPDGSGLRQLTMDAFDDREPAWSHDGTRIAFASDRGGTGGYDIWLLDVRSSQLRPLTSDAANDEMPTWSADDAEVAFASTRADNESGIWAVAVATGAQRRLTTVRSSAPSWSPGGQLVYHATQGGGSRLMLDGRPLTGDENAFPFRVSWLTPTDFLYVSDGKIRRHSINGTTAQTIELSASLAVARASYPRRARDVDSRAPRRVLGIVAPQISPKGDAVAFAALGDIWIRRSDARPEQLTRGESLETEPAWSPDGSRLVYSSDRGGGVLNLWLRDLRTNADRQLTKLPRAAMGAAWSPDGARIAFLEVDGAWRRAAVSVVDVASGIVTRIHAPSFGPGTPTWSPDGRYVAVASLMPYSSRFREGTNQILLIPTTPGAGEPRWLLIDPHRAIDSRAGAGPAWSPDGSRIAVVQGGLLTILPVNASGELTGAARQMSRELAHTPSWTGDSRRVLYQSMDRLRVVDVETGATSDLPVELSYTPAVPNDRTVVHAGRLVDGTLATARQNMDVVIERNRIVRVETHRDAHHAEGRVVDATGLTVMPGLIEFHSHLQKDLGEAHGRAWLAFGITTVRSPGGTPYEAVEDREAIDAGARIGPRIFATGYLLEWQRAYYKMSVAVASDSHLGAELERARRLEHDLLKSYVRMPDLQQRTIIEFAHRMGVPASSHEIYPSALVGVDGVEHTTGTSRRGYSPKVATLQRSYADVSSIIGAAGMTLTPTFALSGTWLQRLLAIEPALRGDPRFALLPGWLSAPVTARSNATETAARPTDAGGLGEFVMAARRAGARIVAGTDTPNPASLHAELLAYVAAGMTPFEALQTATVTPAAALGLEAGSIEPGRIADLVIVAGNPLEDITHTQRVRLVIANGRVFEMSRLLGK